MSIRKKVGRFGTLIAATLLAISTLTLPASTPPAYADDPCSPSWENAVPEWWGLYDDRGVTLCDGGEFGFTHALLQIVDLGDGAKLRLVSDASDPLDPPAADNQYDKRRADDWYDWIKAGNVNSPSPSRLFSTTNASFFVDTSSSTTALSLPEMSTQYFSTCPIPPGACSIQTLTNGWAYGHHSDPAWDASKRGFRLGPPSASTQTAEIFGFDTHYDLFDIASAFDLLGTDGPACGNPGSCRDATVALDPLYGSGDSRRTFVGLDASDRVYILTTHLGYTLSEARDILKSFGSVWEIQLDGGGSTQMYYRFPGDQLGDGIQSTVLREVPDVLAVYLSPE